MRKPVLSVCIAALLLAAFARHGVRGLAEEASQPAAARQYAAAVALQNRELYDLAADEWTRFIADFAADPRVDRAYHYLGVCQLKGKKLDAAQQSFQVVLDRFPKSTMAENAALYLGIAQYTLAQEGNAAMYDKAAASFESFLGKWPESKSAPQALFYAGECLYARGKRPEAVAKYAQVVERFPKSDLASDACYALGVAQQELGQEEAAEKTFDQFLSRYPQHSLVAEVVLRRGEARFALGRFEDAAKDFAAAGANSGFALADRATLRQATALAELKRHEEAAGLFASIPERFPKSAFAGPARLAAGKSFYQAGRWDRASEVLAKAIDDPQQAAEAAHWLARSRLKQGKPAEALTVIDSALAKSPSTWAVRLMLDRADSLYDIPKRRGEAITAYAKLAAEHSKDELAPQALYMAAFAALADNDYATALRHAEDFFFRYPENELVGDVLYVAAEANLQSQRLPEAERLYTRLIDKYPKHADVDLWKVHRVLAIFLQKKYAETVFNVRAILGDLHTPESLAQAQFLIGSSQCELGKFDEAVTALEASLAASPKWRQADETLLALAQAYRQQNQLAKAKAAIKRLQTGFPDSPQLDRAQYRLGEYASLEGDFKAAAAAYRELLKRWPKSSMAAYALHGLAWACFYTGDHAGAVAAVDRLMELDPKHALVARARYARALARQQRKEFPAAIDDLRDVLAAESSAAQKSDARYVLALCQVGVKKSAEAIATLQSILADDPKYASADKVLYELGWALDSQGRAAEAADSFARLTSGHPKSSLAAESWFHVGEFAYQNRDYPKAIEAYRAAKSAAGKAPLAEKAAHKLGWACFQSDDLAGAQRAFAEQCAAWPNGSLAGEGAFMEGECWFKQGKFAEALAAYQRATPPTQDDHALLGLLHAAQAAVHLKKWELAGPRLAEAASRFPDSSYLPEILCEQGFVAQNTGKLDEALKFFEQAVAKTDRETAARAQFLIGEVYFQQKKHAEAIKSYFKVAYGYAFPRWQADATYEAARCFEVLGKVTQAVKQYRELVEKYPQSEKVALARQRLEQLAH